MKDLRIRVKWNSMKAFLCGLPVFIFLWVISGFNTFNGDYHQYEQRFVQGMTVRLEKGFSMLMHLSKKLGISDYQGFLICICFIILCIIFYYACKYTNKAAAVLVLFGFYPYIVLCELVRSAVSFAIILIGVFVLLENKKHAVPKYILLVFLASTVHISSFFYLILPFYKIRFRRKTKLFIILCLDAVIAFITYTPLLQNMMLFLIGESAKYGSLLSRHARFGMLIPITEHFISFLILVYGYRYKEKHHVKTKINGDILLDINIMMLSALSLYFINNEFLRLYYVFLAVNMIFSFEIIYGQSWGKLRLTKLNFLNLFQIFYFFILNIAFRPDIWKVHFEYNIVFEKLGSIF